MSMSINSLGANGSMLAQLQRMQQQMRTLTDVANGNHVNQAKVDNSPVYNPSAQAVQAELLKTLIFYKMILQINRLVLI